MPPDLVKFHQLFGTPLSSEAHLNAKFFAVVLSALVWLGLGLILLLRIPCFFQSRFGILSLFVCCTLRDFSCVFALVDSSVAPHLSDGLRNLPFALCRSQHRAQSPRIRLRRHGGIDTRPIAFVAVARRRPHLRLAKDPQTPYPSRYGIYNYAGIETVEIVGLGCFSMQGALRVRTGNEKIHADTIETATLPQVCSQRGTRFLVAADGKVRDFLSDPAGTTPPALR